MDHHLARMMCERAVWSLAKVPYVNAWAGKMVERQLMRYLYCVARPGQSLCLLGKVLPDLDLRRSSTQPA